MLECSCTSFRTLKSAGHFHRFGAIIAPNCGRLNQCTPLLPAAHMHAIQRASNHQAEDALVPKVKRFGLVCTIVV